MIAVTNNNNDRQIAYWLFTVCVLIFCMVVLGGVTRLTGSGLSMVEWSPIMGIIPPLNETEWMETFAKYRQFPEYQKINEGMSLDEFKSIFVFEYAHRVLGRLIGMAFLLPFLFFWLKKKIRPELTPKLIIMFVLGGLQGLLGWYMVKSGLVSNPHVSQYRLTAHLSAALLIYGYIFWVALGLLFPEHENRNVLNIDKLRKTGIAVTVSICIMIMSGGLVAGTKAGFAYNTFPLMYGYFIPPNLFAMDPFYINFFENITTIQFDHRMIAYLLCVLVPVYWYLSRSRALYGRSRMVFNLLLGMLVIQVMLGIATLVYVVPVVLGAAHQGGAVILLSLALFANFELRKTA